MLLNHKNANVVARGSDQVLLLLLDKTLSSHSLLLPCSAGICCVKMTFRGVIMDKTVGGGICKGNGATLRRNDSVIMVWCTEAFLKAIEVSYWRFCLFVDYQCYITLIR